MSPLDNIRIVLVNSIYGGNVGSACRAMMNMGLSQLVLVNPRPGMDMNDAAAMACHAGDILQNRKEFPTVAEAVADCGLVAGPSNRGGLYREPSKTPHEWAPRLLQAAQDTPSPSCSARKTTACPWTTSRCVPNSSASRPPKITNP